MSFSLQSGDPSWSLTPRTEPSRRSRHQPENRRDRALRSWQPPAHGLDVFLRTVGVELAKKAGLAAQMWGELAPEPLVEELRQRSTALLKRAQRAGSVRADVQPEDITAAVWALRGVIQSERTDPAHHGHQLWRRHLETILRGFRKGS